MMDIENYLKSGIIESYFLGTASKAEEEEMFKYSGEYPEVQTYFKEAQAAFDYYLKGFEVDFPEVRKTAIKQNILDAIRLEKITMNSNGLLSDFIDISKEESFSKLQQLVSELHPSDDFDNIYLKNIYANACKELNLVWVKKEVPMEEHPHLDESFLVLEGTADCWIDGVLTKMSSGDFMRIPPESMHEVIITSKAPAKAIQCRITL